MRSLFLDPHSALGWVLKVVVASTGSVRSLAQHTGLPMILVAALALVASWRVARRMPKLLIEVVVALALLVAATRLGWLRW